ncbi:hypothetical protein SPB21_03690 [Leptothoe sp. ISB3NOV94-8A]
MTTPATTKIVVRVFTRILDCGQECARLWHVLRAMDAQGRGWVRVFYAELAQVMGVSVRTIQRWVSQGLAGGWFRNPVIAHEDGSRTIYLASTKAVRKTLGLEDIGAIAEVGIEHLGRSEAKALCTALEAQYRQRQAYWAAKRAAKGRRKQLVLDPERMATCETMPREKSHVIVSSPFSIPGCSHAGLAKATDWSQATIKRRLDNRWRCDRNLDIIEKKRVATELDDPALLFELRESGQDFLVTKNGLGLTRVLKVVRSTGRSKVVSLGCNIYSTGYELLSCRSLRRRLKKDASQLVRA